MLLGELLALLAALSFAISQVLNKLLMRRMSPVALNSIRATSASFFVVTVFFSFGKASEIPATPVGSLLLIVGGGVLTTVVGDTLYLRFIRSVEISRATTLATALQTLFMVGAGALILREDVTWQTALGALVVITGVYLLSGYRRHGPQGTANLWLGFRAMGSLIFIVLLWSVGLSLMREGLRDVDPMIGNAARTVVIASLLVIALSARYAGFLEPRQRVPVWARKRAQPWREEDALEGVLFSGRVELHVPARIGAAQLALLEHQLARAPDLQWQGTRVTGEGEHVILLDLAKSLPLLQMLYAFPLVAEARPRAKSSNGASLDISLNERVIPPRQPPSRRRYRFPLPLMRFRSPAIVQSRESELDIPAISLGVASGLFGLGLGTTLMFIAIERAGVAVTTILLNSSILLVAPLSILVLHERLNLSTVIGIVVTVGGILLVVI